MSVDAAHVPFLPRGVRLHHCAIRKSWFLLAPERAVKMDAIGVAILKTLDGQRSLDAIVAKLSADFNAPAEQIRVDVSAFLTDLQNRRMVEVRQ